MPKIICNPCFGSSNIKAMGYDYKSKTLEVQFSNGQSYQYESVPTSIYINFWSSLSKGTYFNTHISGKYQTKDL